MVVFLFHQIDIVVAVVVVLVLSFVGHKSITTQRTQQGLYSTRLTDDITSALVCQC